MTTLKKILPLTTALWAAAACLPLAAQANEGTVKVDCKNNCDNVTLGQICDTFALGSEPVAISCENTANPGSGTPRSCGIGGTTCQPFRLTRNDRLGAYCYGNGPGNNSLVICDTTPEAIQSGEDSSDEESSQ
jgi:hypothetical protein